MEILNKAISKDEHIIYYSGKKLISKMVIWSLSTLFFGFIAINARGNTQNPHAYKLAMVMAIISVIFAIQGYLAYQKKHLPVLKISKRGIAVVKKNQDNWLNWEDLTLNNYEVMRQNGIPIRKIIALKALDKKYVIQAASLDVTSDEYLALCDEYAVRA